MKKEKINWIVLQIKEEMLVKPFLVLSLHDHSFQKIIELAIDQDG